MGSTMTKYGLVHFIYIKTFVFIKVFGELCKLIRVNQVSCINKTVQRYNNILMHGTFDTLNPLHL